MLDIVAVCFNNHMSVGPIRLIGCVHHKIDISSAYENSRFFMTYRFAVLVKMGKFFFLALIKQFFQVSLIVYSSIS